MAEHALLSASFGQLRMGDSFSTQARTISEADVVAFARQTGDMHPLHLDAAWAAESQFGKRLAHGLLVLSCAFGLLRADPGQVLAMRRIRDVVFLRPVGIGEAIRVDGNVAALDPAGPGLGVVTLKLLVKNQDDRIVCRARPEILWRAVDDDSATEGRG